MSEFALDDYSSDEVLKQYGTVSSSVDNDNFNTEKITLYGNGDADDGEGTSSHVLIKPNDTVEISTDINRTPDNNNGAMYVNIAGLDSDITKNQFYGISMSGYNVPDIDGSAVDTSNSRSGNKRFKSSIIVQYGHATNGQLL